MTKIWFCHVTGGANNYDFYGYLSESGIEYYRNQGCNVTRVVWEWKMQVNDYDSDRRNENAKKMRRM